MFRALCRGSRAFNGNINWWHSMLTHKLELLMCGRLQLHVISKRPACSCNSQHIIRHTLGATWCFDGVFRRGRRALMCFVPVHPEPCNSELLLRCTLLTTTICIWLGQSEIRPKRAWHSEQCETKHGGGELWETSDALFRVWLISEPITLRHAL